MILGIDPGQTGGLAIINKDNEIIHLIKPPITYLGKTKILDLEILVKELKPFKPEITICMLEEVGIRPGNGAKPSTTIGINYGILLALLTGMKIPFEVIRPQAWKKKMQVPGSGAEGKRIALAKVRQLYPDHKFLAKDDGLVDAILIARSYNV